MDDFEYLIVDKENSSYLVRPTIACWITILFYRSPYKTKNGHIGSKHYEDKKEFINELTAYEQYEEWKNKYYLKLQNQEIIELDVEYFPVIYYYVTCPKCGKDAEIINSMIFCNEDDNGLAICCEHCSEVKSSYLFERLLANQVGICEDTSFFYQKEEMRFHSSIDTEGMTWNEFEGLK